MYNPEMTLSFTQYDDWGEPEEIKLKINCDKMKMSEKNKKIIIELKGTIEND